MEHPIKHAAIAVAGTIGVATVVVTQWIIPTMTASLAHNVELVKDELANEIKKNTDLIQAAKVDHQRDADKISDLTSAIDRLNKQVAQLKSEGDSLRDRLFSSQNASMFAAGNPYPVGFDKIHIGDSKEKVKAVYPEEDVTEHDDYFTVAAHDQVFTRIIYRHSFSKKDLGKVDGITFELQNYMRIINKGLPRYQIIG